MTMRLLSLASSLLVVGTTWASPETDLITELPGLNYEVPFKQYSGFLNANEGQHLHYWFTESQRDPAADPVILWLNGGPGCSSMDGFLNELGPFKIDKEDEFSLIKNPYSWNANASVIFLDAPICTGYSYSDDGSCLSDDDTASMGNYMALQDFFTNKFPELSGNDFYIAGESYGGVYVPTLAQRVQEGQSSYPLQLKGWATGNGMLSYEENDNSILFYAYHHGLIDDNLWGSLIENCCDGGVASRETCNFHNPQSLSCITSVVEGMTAVYWGGSDPYGLYGVCEHPPEDENTDAGPASRAEIEMRHLFNKLNTGRFQGKKHTKSWECFDDHIIQNWMSRTDVREALHIPDHPSIPEQWVVCADLYGQYSTIYANMTAQFQYLMPQVKGLVYNGDWDMVCNFLGNQWFLENLEITEVEGYREWYFDEPVFGSQVAGYVKRFENLDYVTVKGAGHQVPNFKPGQAQKMIYSFINGDPL